MKQKLLWPKLKSASYAARRTPLVCFDSTRTYRRLYRLLRDRFFYDDALYANRYRLEYVVLQHGAPQYRLYRGERLIGVVDVEPERVDGILRQIASHLISVYGFTAEGAAFVRRQTPLKANKYGKPRLL